MTADERDPLTILREVKVTPQNIHYLLDLLIELQKHTAEPKKDSGQVSS